MPRGRLHPTITVSIPQASHPKSQGQQTLHPKSQGQQSSCVCRRVYKP